MPIKCPIQRKEKQKEYSKTYYQRNRVVALERIRLKKIELRKRWEEFKSRLQCTVCGENHPATLDFHHVAKDPSNKKINKLTANGAYKQAIEEIQTKCVVLCSNCHRKHHYDERKNQA
jgi:hypothetical protein